MSIAPGMQIVAARSAAHNLRSASWPMALIFCCLLVAASFFSLVFFIDRYPNPTSNEPFFNYPAVRYLEGSRLTYMASSHAPGGDSVWAYHGPFYPRIQTLTFAALGISQFTLRLPQFLCANLAVLVLCAVLIRSNFRASAVVVALAWLGDQSSHEVLTGRMEGIALLALACGFTALVRSMYVPTGRWSLLAGLSLGLAVGLHPSTLAFVAASMALILALHSRGRLRMAAFFIGGASVAALLVLICWLPDIATSFAQLRWHMARVESIGRVAKIVRLFSELRWTHGWILFLVGSAISMLIVMIRLAATSWRAPVALTPEWKLWVIACAFSAAGLISLLGAAVHSYYLVYFSVWPVIALASFTELSASSARVQFRMRVAFALGAILWIPSLARNSYGVWQAAHYYRSLSSHAFAQRLGNVVPKEARVTGTPELFVIAREAKISFVPLPFFSESTRVAAKDFILLTESDLSDGWRVHAQSLVGRPFLIRDSVFRGAGKYSYPVVLFGPVGAKPAMLADSGVEQAASYPVKVAVTGSPLPPSP